jgi:niacin transporter
MKSTETVPAGENLSNAEASRRRLFEARDLSLGGVFGALALLLPIAFHMLGGGLGKVFLPMYYPILALGLLVSWEVGLTVGLTVPLISSLVTQMPPLPMAGLMMVELAVIGSLASVCRSRGLSIWPSALIALVASRVVGAAAVATVLPLFGLERIVTEYITVGIVSSLPGFIVLLTVVPGAVYAIERASMLGSRHTNGNGAA